MNRYQEISRSIVRERLREKREQRRLDRAMRQAPSRRDRNSQTDEQSKLH